MEKDNSYRVLFQSQEQLIQYVAKVEAFKIMFPEQYKKLVHNLASDINQIISLYHEIITKGKKTCH